MARPLLNYAKVVLQKPIAVTRRNTGLSNQISELIRERSAQYADVFGGEHSRDQTAASCCEKQADAVTSAAEPSTATIEKRTMSWLTALVEHTR